jgi:acyl dehydratase
VHGFGVAIDCEFYRNVRPGDRVNIWNRVLDVKEKSSKFSGRMAMQYLESTFTNQRDEVLCRALGLTARHERKASREKGKYKEIRTHVYTPDERARIDEMVMTEPSRIRGAETRYWDDVTVGESIDEIARGPLSTSDTMAFVIASGRGAAHGALLRHAAKHPKHYIRNQQAGGGIEYTGIGHHREDFAKEVGVPGMYDYLPQRACWFATAITNWMGDDAVLKRLRMEARMFNCQGDTTFIGGTVVKKYVKDRCALVDIEMKGVNQRGELTSPGFATVMLPSRDISTRIPLDGTVVDLDLPPVR